MGSIVKNTGQIVIQCSGRNTQSCNKITTWTNSNYVKVIMSLSMKYSLQCSGRNTEAESEEIRDVTELDSSWCKLFAITGGFLSSMSWVG